VLCCVYFSWGVTVSNHYPHSFDVWLQFWLTTICFCLQQQQQQEKKISLAILSSYVTRHLFSSSSSSSSSCLTSLSSLLLWCICFCFLLALVELDYYYFVVFFLSLLDCCFCSKILSILLLLCCWWHISDRTLISCFVCLWIPCLSSLSHFTSSSLLFVSSCPYDDAPLDLNLGGWRGWCGTKFRW